MSIERRKAGTKKRSPDGLSHPNKNIIKINKILYNFIRYGKSIMKFNLQKKMDLNNRKMANHHPTPEMEQ